MFDFEPFIIDFCEDCDTRHAPIRGCPESVEQCEESSPQPKSSSSS